MKNKDIVHLLTVYLEHRDTLSEEERSIILNTLKILNIQLEKDNGK